ncbi:MAG: hypothetical protein ACPGR7_10355 [Flavobacteriaceae bacterium]
MVNWRLPNTIDSKWCAECLNESAELHGKPEIVNTYQRVQYTSDDFTSAFLNKGIKLSMDGKTKGN